MEPIRVLQVVTLMDRGGLETMLMNYYRHIDRRKIQFDFLEHRSGKHDYTDEILSLGGNIYNVPPVSPFNFTDYYYRLRAFFKDHHEYHIVHSHLDALSTYPLRTAKQFGVPVRIAHSHNTNHEKNMKYLIKRYSQLKLQYYTTHLFSCGVDAGKWLFKHNNFQILNNAIDTKKFTYDAKVALQMKRKLGIHGKFVIGHIGRFFKQKNHGFLLDIFNRLHKINSDCVLLLIGAGELMNDIRQKAKELGLSDAVLFLGVRKDIPELLQAMDIFVFPSLYEGLPVTLIEAQASGLPCIIADTITEEVKITEHVKYVSLFSSIDVWIEQILSYKNGYTRQNNFSTINKNGFDIQANAKWLENFYLKLIPDNES
ncbi:glycosyltransferase family 1 protein [Caldibacillus lycopersici]|uniref:Glycosyltransferase family 1 protein n=1 Tax=Perspicuibacillus lycopersici TaxID=1325689 RepID=A0AAE3IUJ4_9BACI|nr:glycosyltransferase family 1 protein [Perspicuibacillus lycopersici]MCU9612330.1 glycosyltransferase family 1 protein [Perspicuibacillus lycopersici]